MSETIRWDEDVLLEDGKLLSIHRTLTFGPDEWGRSGKGRLKEQSIHFVFNGKKIKWKNDDKWPIYYTPDILDLVNGIPVLVLPVYRWGPCNKYNYPQEGLVAFSYRNSTWIRIPITDVPKALRVNLLRATHAIRYWDEYRNKRIIPSDKLRLETGTGWGGIKAMQTVTEASKLYASYDESCARIHPLPNPQTEAAKVEVTEREIDARQVTAHIQSSSDLPKAISSEEFRNVRGIRAGTGYISESCKGVVSRIEDLRHYREGGSHMLVGYKLLPTNGHPIPLQQSNIKLAPPSLEAVVCNQSFIFSVRRQSKDHLIINRFLHSGTPVDAIRVTLPELDRFFGEGKWPMMWQVLVNEEQVTFTLGTYSYSKLAHLGGMLERQVDYIITLPK